MKNRLEVKAVAGLCLLAIGGLISAVAQPGPANSGAAAVGTNASGVGPKIQFATTDHDFGRAKSGEQVKYTYVFTNIGDALLEVTGVHACGCITFGDYTKRVEPGQSGSIPISFNSTAYASPVTKAITVNCTDKSSPAKVLTFRGTVWKSIEVNPMLVLFNNLSVESPSTTSTVKISNNEPEPFTVSDPESQNKAFTAELKQITPGKEYEVLVSTVPPLPVGSVSGRITLKTSSPEMREIGITVYANNVQPAVTVSPSRINLVGAPLAADQVYSVNFVNKAAKPLVLSEPSINAEGVEVQLSEQQHGQMYAARLTFPKGFTITPGQNVELSVKSSLESSPVIKVPVLQTMRPPAVVAPMRPAVSRTIAAPLPPASNP